jgi:gamma-glutamyltranspeptidase
LERGAIASDHSICSDLGHQILNVDNGNVVDAAVAVALCLGVCNPASSGIGGGMFMVIHIDKDAKDGTVNSRSVPFFRDARRNTTVDSAGKVTLVIDAREVAPIKAHRDMFSNMSETASTTGGLAIAVPGELYGLDVAHAMFGKLSWAQVVNPTIKLARDGVPVSSFLAGAISKHSSERWAFLGLRRLLTKDGSGLVRLKEGDVIKNEVLASFLESVIIEGAMALYNGSHTQQFVDDIRLCQGILTLKDMGRYAPTLRSPLVAKDVFGYTLVGVPPPSSGGATVIGAARFLSSFAKDDAQNILGSPPLKKHRLVEAMRHAFAIRMSLSDPKNNSDIVQAAVRDLVYNGYMDSLRQVTKKDAALPLSKYGGPKWAKINDDADSQGTSSAGAWSLGDGDGRSLRNFGYLEDKGTSHVSIMDNKGNAVSMTSSINNYFGSGVVSGQTGILMNSQMDDFATPHRPNFFGLEPAESNFIAPGKKPLSSMSPTLIFEPKSGADESLSLGDLFMVLGASGGPKIITATLQTFLNHAVEKMDLFDSVASPRMHDQLLYHSKAWTLFESALVSKEDYLIEVPTRTRLELETTGHSLVPINYAGCVQVVSRSRIHQKMSAVSDIRKGGQPAGV